MKKLNLKRIVEGMAVCSDNARKIARDARVMYGRHRYSTAMALSIFSLEEVGKVMLLFFASHAIDKGERIDWGTFWKSWRSHDAKGVMASFLDLGIFGKDAADLARRTIIIGDLGDMREQSLYADYSKNTWWHPKNVPRDWVLEILEAAEDLSEEVWRECNPRRKKMLMRDIQTKEIDVSPKANPFLANLQEGFQELKEHIESINLKAMKTGRGFAA